MPPADASGEQILEAYLEALVAGDCATASALSTGDFSSANGNLYGNLCGEVQVTAFTPLMPPATPSADEEDFATNLTIHGGDESLPDGVHPWFYELRRQADGAWRLVGGGSGP